MADKSVMNARTKKNKREASPPNVTKLAAKAVRVSL